MSTELKKNGKCNWITTSTDAHTLLAHVTSYTARTWKNTVGLWKFPSQCARASIRFLLRLSHTCISSIGVLYDTSSSTYPMCKLVSMLPNIYYLSSLHSVLQATRILCLKYTCARTKKTNICNMYSTQRWVQKNWGAAQEVFPYHPLQHNKIWQFYLTGKFGR